MVHVEGDNGPGWMVPKAKAWDEMTDDERIDRVLYEFSISCPGWCADHSWGTSPPEVSRILHIWDLDNADEPFAGYLLQGDTLSFPDGDLVERDPVGIALVIDPGDAPHMTAVVTLHAGGEPDYDSWELAAGEATELAEKLRGEPHDWAQRIAEVLETLAAAVTQPRRANGVEFIYGAAW